MAERVFHTVRRPGRAELEIKRSRFLGRAEPVGDVAAFQHLLSQVRAEHPEARHHAFAYRIGRDGDTARFSDDGEPGGTAGRPIMEVLIREDVVDAAVVVTRYFGGTLLGSGGLTRAYGQAAAEALREAGPARMVPHRQMLATGEYQHFGAIERAVQREGYALQHCVFTDVVSMTVRVPAGDEEALARLLADLTSGAALVEPGDIVYVAEEN